jgi:hypothetical protein
MKSPPPQVTFTLLYIYIFLHSHVRSYKYIYFYIYIVLLDCVKLYKFIYFYTYMNVNEYYTLTLAQSVNKFHYEIYIYREFKSQTIYTHNTGRDLINGSDPQALANCICSTSSQQASNQKLNNGNVHSQVIVNDHQFMPQ